MAFQDIRSQRKLLSREEAFLLLLLIAVFVGLLALNMYLARILPGGEQFYLRWSGARAFLFEQVEPYSTTIAERTQQVAYGRDAFAREYPYQLNDPFHIVLLYIPLAAVPEILHLRWPNLLVDFAVLRGVWLLLSELALVAMMVSFINSLEWKPPLWLYALLLAFGVFGYYSLIALGSGSPAAIFIFLFFAILYSLRSFADEMAGALLFLVCYQWEMSLVFVVFIFVFVFANRRWRVLNGFGMSFALLTAVAFLAYPGWWLPYTRAVLSDWYRGFLLSFGHVMSIWFPNANFSIGFWTALFLGVVLAVEWGGAVNANYRRLVWTVCLSLAATPLMGLAIFQVNHVILLPAFILIVMLAWERWVQQRVLYVLLLTLLAFAIPFWLYFRIISGAPPVYADLLNILPPLSAVLGLYWMRWWAFRTPRTWSDQIGELK